MRYIANIVASSNRYKFNNYIKVCKTINDIDEGLPTLIVGIENAKSILGDKINYVVRDIDNNTCWTFGLTEKRSENEKDILKFKKSIVKGLKKNIKYKFFNILTCSRHKFKNFLRFLEDDKKKTFFLTNSMVYIAVNDEVIGISMDDCEYIGVDRKKIFNEIKKRFKCVTTYNEFLTQEEKQFFNNDNVLLATMFCYANS